MKKIVKFIKWFYPGLEVKRWMFLLLGGVFFLIFSATRFFSDDFALLKTFDAILFFSSLIVFILGIKYLVGSFFKAIYPKTDKNLIDIIYEKRYLSKGPKIVAFGGGTGLSTLLEGLKDFTTNITAIVAVTDEGGSSGRLREEFGILPPGDIRNCLVSLAEAPQLMRDLFQYRFTEGDGIKGHSFGNLFITALTQVSGSFQDALEESSKVLAIRGKVIPSSFDIIRLKAGYADGSVCEGEDKIPKRGKRIKRLYLIPENVKANPQAIEVIREADIIILGPGSLFTSILPNLLIKEISEQICARDDIPKIYICNIMTQCGETDGFTAYDHVNTLINYGGNNIINSCLVNCGGLQPDLLLKYSRQGSFPVIPAISRIESKNVRAFEGDFVNTVNYIRHDTRETARMIVSVYSQFKKEWKKSHRK